MVHPPMITIVTRFAIGHEHITSMLVGALVANIAPSPIPEVIPRFAELLLVAILFGGLDGNPVPFRCRGTLR